MNSINYHKKDDDIEHLSLLVTNLIHRSKENSLNANEIQELANIRLQNSYRTLEESLKVIKQLEQENRTLKGQNQQLKQQINVLDQQKVIYMERIRIFQEKQSSQTKIRSIKQIQQLSPQQSTPIAKISQKSVKKYAQKPHDNLLMYQTNINGSIGGSPSKDQIYRLNSYLIQYNTNIKLLLQKYNYTLKLRDMGINDQAHDQQLLKDTSLLLKNRKVIEDSRSILRHSRKQYFESDESSDIQEEHNNISL